MIFFLYHRFDLCLGAAGCSFAMIIQIECMALVVSPAMSDCSGSHDPDWGAVSRCIMFMGPWKSPGPLWSVGFALVPEGGSAFLCGWLLSWSVCCGLVPDVCGLVKPTLPRLFPQIGLDRESEGAGTHVDPDTLLYCSALGEGLTSPGLRFFIYENKASGRNHISKNVICLPSVFWPRRESGEVLNLYHCFFMTKEA